MMWIDARGIIAAVKHMKTVFDWAVVYFPTYPMRQKRFALVSTDTDPTIARRQLTAAPLPAFVAVSPASVCPEAIYERYWATAHFDFGDIGHQRTFR